MKPFTILSLIIITLLFSGCAVDYHYDDDCYYDYYGGYWCDNNHGPSTINYVYNDYEYQDYDWYGHDHGDYICFEDYEAGCVYLYCYDHDFEEWYQYDVTCS